ncbi:MAG: putative phage abortive infection protein [Candidatus Marinarcus sp.]|uniref:putative phage abortive infection protein n=1 Tax=Candidatus Marinarcus sp. TaxID=3100987 RepID=UPI003AFFEA1A
MFYKQVFPHTTKKNKTKLPWVLISFGLVGFVCSVFVFGFYGITFLDYKVTADAEHFGQFGDFIGGTLNPILAFLSFMALLYTIKIQMDELKFTRDELKESRIAQQEQSQSLRLQNQATKIQMFENTFFQLLRQHNEYLDLVVEEKIKIDYFFNYTCDFTGCTGKELKCIDDILLNFCKINQTNRTLKNYFTTLYQILKYIHEYAKTNDINAKFYTNIIRALIDDEILRLLAINCIAYPLFTQYKKYIEEYAFFEHIYLNEKQKETKTILDILFKYNFSAFGNNIRLKELLKKPQALA